MTRTTYDAIVLGAGGVGSAAMWQLARRGLRVLGIDRFAPPHDRGSSHGQTRIIRQAYFEHSDYVPLLLESYRLWEELEELSGQRLKLETGLLEAGPAVGQVVPGVLEAAAQHGLDVERLSAWEIATRWPPFCIPESSELVGVYERRAGILFIENCIRACLSAAERYDTELLAGVEVLRWAIDGDVVVTTSVGVFRANRLVIAAGAWAAPLLSLSGVQLQVRRKPLLWFAPSDADTEAARGFPCYLFELPQGVFYGFPAIDEQGLKVAEHTGGEVVVDPLAVDRSLRPADSEPIEAFLRQYLPSALAPCRRHAVCLYTMSPDEHFIVDRHPDDQRVVFAAGLSGHGYKFAPALGQALAEMAIDGVAKLPMEFLTLARFGAIASAGRCE